MKIRMLRLLLVTLYLCGLTNAEESRDGFVSLFDGKSLAGWREAPKGKELAWSVKDGVIRGEGKENRQGESRCHWPLCAEQAHEFE